MDSNVDFDEYTYSGYSTGFDACGSFSLSDGSGFSKKVMFGINMSLLVHIDNSKSDILILGKGPTNRLGDTTLTAEK